MKNSPALTDPESLRAIADDTYDWESWIAPDGTTLWVNPAVERMTGHTVDECLAMSGYPLPMVHPDDRDRIAAVLRSALAGSAGNDLEFRIVHKDGSERWLAMSWQSTFDSKRTWLGYRTSVRDIHDRKRLEHRLLEARRRAEEADRAKTEFLAVMSHELRTPIQCIEGYARLLLELDPSPDQARYIDILRAQNRALLHIVDEVLELSSLVTAPPPLVEDVTDLAKIAADVVEANRPLLDGKPVELAFRSDVPEPIHVRADGPRIRQILANLVGNAVKFTPEGRIEVGYLVEPLDAHRIRVRFEVIDTGIGIPESTIPIVFEPFRQADSSTSRKYGGSGLGLAIVRRLVDVFGGTIALESKVGVGSRFTVTLDLARATGDAPANGTRSERPRASPSIARLDRHFAAQYPLTILVADDSAPSLEFLSELLRLHGYRPDAVPDGARAIEVCRTKEYDLIVLDWQMPEVDGPTAAKAIRSEARGKPPLLVALTANVFAAADPELAQRGFDGALTKPASLEDLQAVLRWAAQRDASPLGPRKAPRRATKPAINWLDPAVEADLRATMTSDGSSMFDRVARRVLDDLPTLMTQLGDAVARVDRARLERLAHQVKGNCLVIGSRPIAELAGRLEHLAETANPRRLRKQHGELVDAVLGLSDHLRSLLA